MVETTRIEPLMLVRSQKIMKVPKNGGDIYFYTQSPKTSRATFWGSVFGPLEIYQQNPEPQKVWLDVYGSTSLPGTPNNHL